MMEGKYIIRPSGNPLTAEQQKAMMSTEGMEMGTQELVAINSMDISGDMAQGHTPLTKSSLSRAPRTTTWR